MVSKFEKRTLGLNHPDVAERLPELGVLELAQAHHGRAKELLQRSLPIREKSLGSEHPEIARSLLNYAVVLRKTHEKTEAKQVEARAMAILSAFPSLRQ